MFQPIAGIIKQLAKLDLNDPGIDSNVSPWSPIRSGPFPDFPQHVLMQVANELLVEQYGGGPATVKSPALGLRHSARFKFVEFATKGNVCRDEVLPVLWRERSGPVISTTALPEGVV
jgi:hypothetical protein